MVACPPIGFTMRIALVHDWLTGMRGGERVLSLLCRLLPRADLLTLIHAPGSCDRHIEAMPIRTSPLDRLPGVGRYYRGLLPLMPWAIARLDGRRYDLIVSCSHCVAKGIPRWPHSAHACYCFTPMRYAWDRRDSYPGPAGLAMGLFSRPLRAWDRRSAANVDHFMANSRTVAGRIARCYGRKADVVYSPINTGFFTPDDSPRDDFYLVVGAMVPYKRAEQAVEAFARLGRPLRMIGSGPQFKRLRSMAPPNVTLLGWQDDEVVRDHYRRCRALVFPGEEDFGLVPLEAMACGAPVIAYGAGGATETVLDIHSPHAAGPTGILYTPQTVAGLVDAIRHFERVERRFDGAWLTAWARQFGEDRFVEEFRRSLGPLLSAKGLAVPWSDVTPR